MDRGVDKFVRLGGAGMLLNVYMPIIIQCTAILLDRMNLKNLRGWGSYCLPLHLDIECGRVIGQTLGGWASAP